MRLALHNIGKALPFILFPLSVVIAFNVFYDGADANETGSSALPEFITVNTQTGAALTIGRFEITQAQWGECVSAGHCENVKNSNPEKTDHPVTNVNWFDVQNYIAWLGSVSGREFRLPTQAEWYDISADHKPIKQPKLFDDPRMAWAADYDITAEPKTRITRNAGGFGANNNGLFDIKGNVWEWTATQCGSHDVLSLENCRSGRIAMGEHIAVLSEFTRNPGNASCGAGIPPANLGFRLVMKELS